VQAPLRGDPYESSFRLRMSQADDESSDFLSAGGWCGFLRTLRSVERRKRITPTCGLAGHRVSVLAAAVWVAAMATDAGVNRGRRALGHRIVSR
jgi:hypothetical protein